jgi:hypothetical protein
MTTYHIHYDPLTGGTYTVLWKGSRNPQKAEQVLALVSYPPVVQYCAKYNTVDTVRYSVQIDPLHPIILLGSLSL